MTQYCSSCGSELVPNAKFCNKCGQAVAAMPQEEAPSPEPPSGDRPGGGVKRWFAGASTPWTVMLVVSVVLAVCLVGVGAWLALAGNGEEEEGTPTARGSPPAGAVGATATPRTVASPTAPAPTLPSGRIAFVSERDGNSDIYVMNADGSGQTNLTKNAAADTDPAWSPDGQRIAWASDRNGNFDIYIANADGSEATRLTASPVDELTPRWSPDGERIAFSRLGEIIVMNSDGSATWQLTESESESTAAPCKAGGFLGGWSPDGTQLTFYAASISQGSGQICIVDADGSNLTVVKADPDTYHVEPAWSPLDRRIAYRSLRQDNHEVYVVNADGSDDTNLTGSPAIDIKPAWSPDGRWIAFASNGDGNFEIYIMRSDGSEVTRLTNDAAKDWVPAWGAPRLQ